MSLSKTEAALASILTEHFDNCENPHETIYRISLLLPNADYLSAKIPGSGPETQDNVKPEYGRRAGSPQA